MRTLTRREGGSAGFTLVELMISVALIGTVLTGIAMTMITTRGSYERGLTKADVEGQAQRILERIKQEVRAADRSSVVLAPAPPFPASSIEFRPAGGWAGGALQVGPLRAIRMLPMAGEVNDGADNNGNGLVDEQRIVLVPDVAGAPGLEVGWGNWVRELAEGEVANGLDDDGNGVIDEPGLWFTYDAVSGALTIQVTVERALPNGVRFASTKRTLVHLRNQ